MHTVGLARATVYRWKREGAEFNEFNAHLYAVIVVQRT